VLYFIFSLILSLILAGAVLAGLIKSLQINWSRRNRRPVSFLAPVILLLVFLALSMHLAVPRILDMISMIDSSLPVEEVTVAAEAVGWGTLRDDDRTYYFNQWQYQPQTGKTYRITYTPRSYYISEFIEITEPDGATP